jgi:hypothetical protein
MGEQAGYYFVIKKNKNKNKKRKKGNQVGIRFLK